MRRFQRSVRYAFILAGSLPGAQYLFHWFYLLVIRGVSKYLCVDGVWKVTFLNSSLPPRWEGALSDIDLLAIVESPSSLPQTFWTRCEKVVHYIPFFHEGIDCVSRSELERYHAACPVFSEKYVFDSLLHQQLLLPKCDRLHPWAKNTALLQRYFLNYLPVFFRALDRWGGLERRVLAHCAERILAPCSPFQFAHKPWEQFEQLLCGMEEKAAKVVNGNAIEVDLIALRNQFSTPTNHRREWVEECVRALHWSQAFAGLSCWQSLVYPGREFVMLIIADDRRAPESQHLIRSFLRHLCSTSPSHSTVLEPLVVTTSLFRLSWNTYPYESLSAVLGGEYFFRSAQSLPALPSREIFAFSREEHLIRLSRELLAAAHYELRDTEEIQRRQQAIVEFLNAPLRTGEMNGQQANLPLS